MNFILEYKKNGEFYIINKNDVINLYEFHYILLLKNINSIDLSNELNNYEYLYFYKLNDNYFGNTNLKTIYENWNYFNKKYIFKNDYKNNNKTISILKNNPIDKITTALYELLYKYNKYLFNSSDNIINILQITNTNIFFESFNLYANKYNININYYTKLLNDNDNDNELINRYNLIEKSINNRIYNKLHLIDYNIKYDIIIQNCRAKNKYYASPYWIYSSNRIKVVNLLESILLLKNNGCLIMPFYMYRTNIQKEIYYLFNKLFKKTKLFIPESQQIFFLSSGFIIGINYIDNIIDQNIIKNIINDLNNKNDDINIKFDKYFDKFSNANIKFKIDFDNNNKNYGLYSFYKINENDIYNNKLQKYFNLYYSKCSLFIVKYNNNIIYNQENFDLKISSAINWSLKYKFDLQEDLNYTKFIKNNYYEIYEKIKNFNDKETVILKFNKLNNKNISFDELFNYIKKINLINNYIINNIDTRDIRIYRQVRINFDPFYNKFKYKISYQNKNHLNQPFFKLYEMLELFDLFDKNLKQLNTLHLCELPGTFIFSLKHFIKTKTNIKYFNWKAQSLNENHNEAKLEDILNMLIKYKDRYDFGPKNNGNLLYDYNLEYYEKYIIDNNIDFLTSDCGMKLKEDTKNIMNELESKILLLMLKTKKNGISKIVYPFQNNDIEKIIIIGLIYTYYDVIYFYKSEQAYTSNEFYIIFKNFNNKIENFDIIKNTKYNDDLKKLKYLINNSFYCNFKKNYKNLIKIKNDAINNKIYLVDRYHIIKNNKDIYNKILKNIEYVQHKWIKKFNFI